MHVEVYDSMGISYIAGPNESSSSSYTLLILMV